MANGLAMLITLQDDMEVTKVLTRRNIDDCTNFKYRQLLTHSVQELLEHSDVLIECSGDVLHGTEVIDLAMNVGIPVVTMNAELQVTTGSYFSQKGYITEAEGDQPGCLAALKENISQMGFKPLVYGNIKGYLHTNPSVEEMLYWSEKQGISLPMQVSFTDGTKLQIEQALVANGLGATIVQSEMLGLKTECVMDGGNTLAKEAKQVGLPISDYILSPSTPSGVFITGVHQDEQQPYLKYLKMGDGPYYTLHTNYHLCHFEVLKTLRRVIRGGSVLINNSSKPQISVAAVPKKNIKRGTLISRAIGSFECRGIAVKMSEFPNHVPIGLMNQMRVKQNLSPGQIITFDDVELQPSLALDIWKEIKVSAAYTA